MCADGDLYVAAIDDRVVLKIGSRFDMGDLAPSSEDYNVAATGKDYCIWEKKC